MKGNPALRTLLVLLLLGAVFLPVHRVISPVRPVSAPSSQTPQPLAVRDGSGETSPVETARAGTLTIKAAPSPLSLSVVALGKTLLTLSDSSGEAVWSRDASIPPGTDLIVRAEWPDNRPHALRAEFVPMGVGGGGGSHVSRDFWAGRTLEDTLPLP